MRVTALSAALLLPLAVSGRPAWHELDGYTFQKYVHDYGKSYTLGSAEYASREAIFIQELNRVRELNARGLSWKEGINERSDLTSEEKHKVLGLMSSSAAHMHRNYQPKHAKSAPPKSTAYPTKPPKSIDWRDYDVIDTVANQGACGSCWAFSSVEVVSAHAALDTGLSSTLSPQQLVSCAPNPHKCGGTGGCEGSTNAVAFDYIIEYGGLYIEDQYPYTAFYNGYTGNNVSACSTPPNLPSANFQPQVTIDGYVVLTTNDYDDLYDTLGTKGPVGVSVDARSWSAYEGGVFQGCGANNTVEIDHAVLAVGYGKDSESGLDYWTIKNSWGTTWGEAGYIRLFREPSAAQVNCYIDPVPQDGNGCADDDASNITVCGMCGVLSLSTYPTGAAYIGNVTYFGSSSKSGGSGDDDDDDETTSDALIAMICICVLLAGALAYILFRFKLVRKSDANGGLLSQGLMDSP